MNENETRPEDDDIRPEMLREFERMEDDALAEKRRADAAESERDRLRLENHRLQDRIDNMHDVLNRMEARGDELESALAAAREDMDDKDETVEWLTDMLREVNEEYRLEFAAREKAEREREEARGQLDEALRMTNRAQDERDAATRDVMQLRKGISAANSRLKEIYDVCPSVAAMSVCPLKPQKGSDPTPTGSGEEGEG